MARQLVIDAEPELIKRLDDLQRQYEEVAPDLFWGTWACNRPICDGQPHDDWTFKHARTTQIVPDGWRMFYIVGGRGSGKTWAGAHNFAQLVLDTQPDDGDTYTEWAVVAPTYGDVRDVCVEGQSGLIRAFGGFKDDGGLVDSWDRSYGHLRLVGGQVIFAANANDGALRSQGKSLYGLWCDEVGLWRAWERAWLESLLPALRKGHARAICTGTPKRSSLAKYLLDDPLVGRTRLRMVDNQDNLAPEAVEDLLRRFGGTRLGQQELEGILADDAEGALWTRDNIDADRITEHIYPKDHPHEGDVFYLRADESLWRPPPFWLKVIVALDPSDGLEHGDEQGIAVVAQSADDHELYVLHSDGLKVEPWSYLKEAQRIALSYKQAYIPSSVEIVMEKNHGSGYLMGLMAQVVKDMDVSVGYRSVDANQSTGGKYTRAESVSGLYERHKVHHVGTFSDLEDQMAMWTGKGREPSPDRMDALVWALKQFEDFGLDIPSEPIQRVYVNADASGITGTVFAPKPVAARGARELPDVRLW